MMTEIAGLPFWELTFDADGDPDGARRDAFLAEVPGRGVTDLIVFAHGWNNDPAIARRLYTRLLRPARRPARRAAATGRARSGWPGVVWPSQRWSDEPIPDFAAARRGRRRRRRGRRGGRPRRREAAGRPDARPDDARRPARRCSRRRPRRWTDGRSCSPGRRRPRRSAEFHRLLGEFATARRDTADDDGEGDRPRPGLRRRAADARSTTRRTCSSGTATRCGRAASTSTPATAAARRASATRPGGLLHGAKEALRQATYWQMKNRAGTVGRNGLGPLLGRLAPPTRQSRVHLVGHSFGARLVSYALAGLPAGPVAGEVADPAGGSVLALRVRRPLPFAAGRKRRAWPAAGPHRRPAHRLLLQPRRRGGPLLPAGVDRGAGRLGRCAGPVLPLGRDGRTTVRRASRPSTTPCRRAGPGAAYQFRDQQALNIDASDVVRNGGPPSGAHSDIVHPELTWVVLAAGGLA